MIDIYTQDGKLAFSVKTSEEIRAEIVHTTDAFDEDKHFWLVELYRVRPNYDCMERPMTTCADCALYRTKDEAANELLRLWRQFRDNGVFDKFQFKSSDINALELVKLRTAFI